MKLKPDATLRRRWFVAEAMSHPAKGHLGLWWEILERYTQPGQTVLDPMAGIGSTLIGALMGRNVICVEMEPHFVVPMKASWAKMRQQVMLGQTLGQALIIQADARCLPLGRADCVVTSPPYEGSIEDTKDGTSRGIRTRFFGQETTGGRQGYSQGYTRPDAIVTSPPYEGTQVSRVESLGEAPFGGPNSQARGYSYTRPVDAVVTSPPY